MSETTLRPGVRRTGFLQTIGRALNKVFSAYRRRKTIHELAALDNHILQDIGLDRASLNAASLPDHEADRQQ